MKKKFFLFACTILITLNISVAGQGPVIIKEQKDQVAEKEYKVLKPLKIGDKVPESLLIDAIRSTPGLTIADIKGKLIILDFWNKYCSSCLEAFPRMEEIQAQSNRIKIIPVTYNKREELKRLLEVSPNLKNLKLSAIIGDTILNKIFPHMAEPFHVWIDSNLTVIATTNGTSTTLNSVGSYLKGKMPDLVVRVDNINLPKLPTPIIDQLYESDKLSNVLSYSLITKRSTTDPRTGVGVLFKDGKTTGMWILNSTIPILFEECFPPERRGFDSIFYKFVIETLDSLNIKKYIKPANEDLERWRSENQYCYELKLAPQFYGRKPSEIMKKSLPIALNDLEKYFSVSVGFEIRRVKCYVLTADSQTLKKYASKTNKPSMERDPDSDMILLRKISARTIAPVYFEAFRNKENMPILNGIQEDILIDIDLKQFSTTEEVKEELKRLGFNIKEEDRDLRCLVIKEVE